jgi:hypothetical protein
MKKPRNKLWEVEALTVAFLLSRFNSLVIWFIIGSVFYILKILPLPPYEQKGYKENPWIVWLAYS